MAQIRHDMHEEVQRSGPRRPVLDRLATHCRESPLGRDRDLRQPWGSWSFPIGAYRRTRATPTWRPALATASRAQRRASPPRQQTVAGPSVAAIGVRILAPVVIQRRPRTTLSLRSSNGSLRTRCDSRKMPRPGEAGQDQPPAAPIRRRRAPRSRFETAASRSRPSNGHARALSGDRRSSSDQPLFYKEKIMFSFLDGSALRQWQSRDLGVHRRRSGRRSAAVSGSGRRGSRRSDSATWKNWWKHGSRLVPD